MPNLTRTARQKAATGADRLGLGVPGYAHPLVAPVEWAELTRPGTPLHWAVLNVAGGARGGPGSRPDPHCLEAAGKLRNAGIRVLGHLDAAHGTRAFGDQISEAQRYLDWYRVDGFYLDRCPTDRDDLLGMRRTAETLRALREGAHLVFGHGAHPCPGYAELADQLVTFTGPWSEYRWSQVAEWTADHPPERFCHLVHGVPRTHLEEALRIARWQGAGTIYFTDRPDRAPRGKGRIDPFETLPGYWDEIVSRIGPGISE
ncbi:spherulation-specific family 4 protein [Streptomyces sp. NBC_00083]|uniref:spherulation-specific family 4 protein n=1 Tax=Streptomyces sp. NBC_00083 TaxID=2975647 RepID=UPI002251FE95|nr:spherulation-specific family 4 protein [Streptomyces sp. NBC_00083]MCX5385505.1 spherulation-specific family 4 protein [Streptomyces sp. NBC_00083]